MKLSRVIGGDLVAVSKNRGGAGVFIFFGARCFLLLNSFAYSLPPSPDEYGTGSGSDRVPFRLHGLGVAERPGRYRFRFCILRPTLARYTGLLGSVLVELG